MNIADQIWDSKYRLKQFDGTPVDLTVDDTWRRVASALASCEPEDQVAARRQEFFEVMESGYFSPAGRIIAGAGTGRNVTLSNCFTMGTIPDSMDGIFESLKEAALTMQQGGGIGYDFSPIRPNGTEVKGVQAGASGPLSFMDVWDSMCRTVMSAGSRRGAMMATMRCDHPDIFDFVNAKKDPARLRMFNLSVLVTDAFMDAVKKGEAWRLHFENAKGECVSEKWVEARDLWNEIMRSTYAQAEPGVIFIDRMNADHNLGYLETIATTNPSMPAGTMVHTNNGIFPIESLEGKEFKVKSLDGRWAKAKCFLSSDSAEVLEIDFGGGKTVRSTKEHRWPVHSNGRYLKSYASELREDDRIPLNLNERLGLNNRPDLGYDDGLIAGIVFGDGCYNVRRDDGRAYMSVHCNKKDNDLQEAVSNYFAVPAKVQTDEVVLNITKDAVVREFVKKVGLSFGDKSKLPDTVWNSNDAFIGGFIDGIFSTDGHVSDVAIQNAPIMFTNKNANVCRELALLLAFHGVNCNIRTSQSHAFDGTFDRSDISISHGNTIRFANLFQLTCSRKQARLSEHLKNDKRDHVSSTHQVVKGVKTVGNHRVWDISVYHDEHVFPSEWCYTGNCGEKGMGPYASCLLGSINVAKLIENAFTNDADLNRDLLRRTVYTAIRMMDNVIEVGQFPLKAQLDKAKDDRQLGLGVTGLADALIMLGMKYASVESLKFTENLMRSICIAAYEASNELAIERGAFPTFDADEFLSPIRFAGRMLPNVLQNPIRKFGIRNALLLSIAPTGTISLFAGNVSSGIEPIFAPSYTRKVLQPDGTRTEERVEDYAVAAYRKHFYESVYDPSIHPSSEWSDDYLPDYFVTAQDLSPEAHVRMQAAVQKWVDSSISKTVNLPEDISFEDFEAVYLLAYESGCKGCTTYRPNDITGSVLSVDTPKTEAAAVDPVVTLAIPSRPSALDGKTYKMKWPGDDHALYVTINNDDDGNPFELFLNTKNINHHAWMAAMARTISAVFRRGGDVTFIAHELREVFDPKGGAWVNGKYVPSMIAAIGNVILKHIEGEIDVPSIEQEVQDEDIHHIVSAARAAECPACGEFAMKNEGGCETCASCGHSKCG